MRKLINRLAALDADKWHSLAMKMGWVFRMPGVHKTPPIILAGLNGKEPDRETWDRLRSAVNAARKASRATERRYIEKQKAENRRRYMADYMRIYRERQRAAG